jgi:D-lactate dehydrogenase
MAFSSKGFFEIGESKREELLSSLRDASQNGRFPVVVDTSPCAQRLMELGVGSRGFEVFELPRFITSFVVPRVKFNKVRAPVSLHVPCSVKGKSEERELLGLAKLCADDVFIPNSIPCCGFAGDRGFSHPELTASALVTLNREIPANCVSGFSTSRTCEIGVSLHSDVSYQSIAFLVNEAIKAAQ